LAVLRKAGVTVVGWVLVVAGVAALALPGPGLLLLLAGLVVLSGEYAWAERRTEPVRRKALQAARAGVATYPRIGLSALSACLVIAAGVVWWIDPSIPVLGPLGPRLPFGGWASGSGIVLSGLVALGLLVYSAVKFPRAPKTKRGTPSAPVI
jgi:Putative transmembrane protein (PGPGW)